MGELNVFEEHVRRFGRFGSSKRGMRGIYFSGECRIGLAHRGVFLADFLLVNAIEFY